MAGSGGAFVTTRWTVVLTAAQSASAGSMEAFGQLYRDYWPALYAYVRRRGYPPTEAEDITQDFFIALLEKDRLRNVKREGGRFRAFLLAALRNHLANVWDRAQTVRRGGGVRPLALDEASAEAQYQLAGEGLPPESLFDRQWALSLIEIARRGLEAELTSAGKGDFYRLAAPLVWDDPSARGYGELAAECGLSEGALRVAVHRLRHRFGERLRAEVARTVEDPAEVPTELRHLIAVAGHPETPAR